MYELAIIFDFIMILVIIIGTYQGELDTNGQKQGFGTIHYANGNKYCGAFKDNEMNGDNGMFTFRNGDVYTNGGFVAGIREGNQGRLVFANGVVYEGGFSGGFFKGTGELTFPSGYKYKGEYVNGHRDGKGRVDYHNGTFYSGGFKYGLFHGEGSCVLVSGQSLIDKIYDGGVRLDAPISNTYLRKQPSSIENL